MQPANQFNLGGQPTQPQRRSLKSLTTQLIHSIQAMQFMKKITKCTSRDTNDKKNDEYLLKWRLHMSWAPGSTKKNKQVYKYKSRRQAGGDEYRNLGVSRWNRRGRGGVGFSRSTQFLRIICRERLLCLLVTWEVEVEVQA